MKGRESETESWCWSLSKKMLFLSPAVFRSLSVFLAVLMYSDKPTVLRWWNRRADTTQQMKSVSWWLEAHTCCLCLSFSSPTVFLLIFFLLFFLALLDDFVVGVNRDQSSPKHLIGDGKLAGWMHRLPRIACTLEPLTQSHSWPYSACKESSSRVVLQHLTYYLIIL